MTSRLSPPLHRAASTAATPPNVAKVCVAVVVVAAGLAVPAVARADTVFTVSLTNGGLFRFDSANPYGTMTILSGTGTFEQPSALALGPDGNLYVGDLGSGGRISRYNLTTGSVSTVALVNSGVSGYAGPVWPAAIAFRPASQGGQMLVGRSPFGSTIPYPQGPVLQIDGWQGNSPVVTDYTTGTTQAYAPGLAVAPDGTLYASNALYNPPYMVGNVLSFGTSGAIIGEVVPDGSQSGGLFGPSGLVLSGSTLYTASVMNGTVYATDLTTGSTSQFGPSLGTFEAGAMAQLASGDLLVGSPNGAGNIYQVWSSGSSTLYDSAVGAGSLGEAFDLGQIGGLVTMVVPEPTAVALAACGLATAGAWWRRRRRRVA